MAEPPPGGSQEPEKPRTWWETPLSDVSALTAASRRCECSPRMIEGVSVLHEWNQCHVGMAADTLLALLRE